MYIVYGKDKRVLIPGGTLLLGGLGEGQHPIFNIKDVSERIIAVTVGSLVVEGMAEPGSSVFSPRAWIQSFVAITLGTNLPCTSKFIPPSEITQCAYDAALTLVLVAYKLWSVERQLYRVKKNRYLTKVAVTIIESGALYSAFLVVLLATYLKGDWSLYIPFFLVRENVFIIASPVLTLHISRFRGSYSYRKLL